MRYAVLPPLLLSTLLSGCLSASLSAVPEFGGLGQDGCSPVLASFSGLTTAPSRAPTEAPCPEPVELRERARQWVSDGRLDRTVRVLLDMKARCPAAFAASQPIFDGARASLEALLEDRDATCSSALYAEHAGDRASARALRDACLVSAEAEQHASAVVEIRPGGGSLPEGSFSEAIRRLQFSSNGEELVAAGEHRLTIVWSLSSGMPARAVVPTEEVGLFQPFVLALSPDGDLVANRHGESVDLWSTKSGTLARSLSGHQKRSPYSEELDSVAFSNDGRLVATGDELGSIRVFRAEDGRLLSMMEAQESRLVGLTWSPDGRMVATASRNEPVVRIRDVRTRETRLVLRTDQDELYSLLWSADGRVIAAADLFHEVRAWDLQTCESTVMTDWPPCHIYEDGSCGGLALFSLSLSRRGDHTYGVFNDDGVAVWDTATGRRTAFVRLSKGDRAWSSAVSPDGRLFAVGAESGVHVFRIDGGRLSPLVSMAISTRSDGKDGYVLDTARAAAPPLGERFTNEESWPRPTGYYDASGWGESSLQCRVGELVFPVWMCADRLRVRGLLAKRAAGAPIQPEDTGVAD